MGHLWLENDSDDVREEWEGAERSGKYHQSHDMLRGHSADEQV